LREATGGNKDGGESEASGTNSKSEARTPYSQIYVRKNKHQKYIALKSIVVFLKSPRRRCEAKLMARHTIARETTFIVVYLKSPRRRRDAIYNSKTYDDQGSNISRCVPEIASPEARTTLNSKAYDDQGNKNYCSVKSPRRRLETNLIVRCTMTK